MQLLLLLRRLSTSRQQRQLRLRKHIWLLRHLVLELVELELMVLALVELEHKDLGEPMRVQLELMGHLLEP